MPLNSLFSVRMKLPSIFLIICQLVFASVSLSAHSMDHGHESHDGMHFHLQDSSEFNTHESEHDANSHIHFTLDLLCVSEYKSSYQSPDWQLTYSTHWFSQSYRPAIPPPDSNNLS